MIIRAATVVTMDGLPIVDGAVAIAGNKIVEVGAWKNIEDGDEVIDLGECVLLPGLINAHCHLDYTCLRRKISRRDSFADWIRAINAEKAKLSADDYVSSINDGFVEARRFGTTSVANLTGFPELIAQIEAPIRTWWFAELIDIRDRNVRWPDRGVDLAPHAPYTASPELYRRCDKNASLLTTHLAESCEEMQMSLHGAGALAEFLRSIAGELFEASGATPVEYLSKICQLDHRWLLVHVNEIRDGDIDLLRKANIVHCPRSHAYFQHAPFQFATLKERGINICLGTDSLASNDDLSLFAEMRAFRQKSPRISAREIFEMVTLHPARALGMTDVLGRIREGFFADLVALPCGGGEEDIFDEILNFDAPISWMMIDGVAIENA